MGLEVKDNQDRVKEVIGRATGEEPKVIAVPIELIHFVGSLTKRCITQKALFLSQLIYWSDRGIRKDKFIFKTQKVWSEETGLSESQISDYTEEFYELELLEYKVKKAYGNPTGHYKLKFDVFLERFHSFLQKRIQNKLENQSDETDDSLTENTTEITNTENSLTKLASEGEEKFVDQCGNVKKADSSFLNGQTDSNHNGAGDHSEERVLIPLDYEPTWDLKYQAIRKFSDKSPADITKKFIDYYSNKGFTKSMSDWHKAWWNWISTERPSPSNMNLDDEEQEIIDKVMKDIYDASYEYPDYLFSYQDMTLFLSGAYSEFTVTEAMQRLYSSEYFARVSGYYFNWAEAQASDEWNEAVEEGIRALNLEDDPIEVCSIYWRKLSLNEMIARNEDSEEK